MWLLYYAISLKKVLLKFYTKSLPSGLGGIKKKKQAVSIKIQHVMDLHEWCVCVLFFLLCCVLNKSVVLLFTENCMQLVRGCFLFCNKVKQSYLGKVLLQQRT